VLQSTVRLPTEAEWAAAAGAVLGADFPGGARAAPDEGELATTVPVGDARDVSPCGVRGMFGNAREIVSALRWREGADDEFLSKGAGVGDRPADAAIRLVRPIGRDDRDPRTGFRCVRELKGAEVK
jgi:formylglycine-generating enzyme required for sulfatase activity